MTHGFRHRNKRPIVSSTRAAVAKGDIVIVSDRLGPAPIDRISYTVGMPALLGYPEIVVTGLPNDYGEPLVRSIAQISRLLGLPTVGEVVGSPEHPIHAMLKPICGQRAQRMLPLAAAVRDDPSAPLEAVQLVLSDDAGRFPWQPGFCAHGDFPAGYAIYD